MANQTAITRDHLGNGLRKQIIYSKPLYIVKKAKYLSPKGKKLLDAKLITEDEAWQKYGKIRYMCNPDAEPIKVIYHNN